MNSSITKCLLSRLEVETAQIKYQRETYIKVVSAKSLTKCCILIEFGLQHKHPSLIKKPYEDRNREVSFIVAFDACTLCYIASRL